MRANSIIGDFNAVLNQVEDDAPITTISKEDMELTKISGSGDWKILQAYINNRIQVCKDEMFKKPLDGGDLNKIGAGFLAARAVVNELQLVIDKVEVTAATVKEALSTPNETE